VLPGFCGIPAPLILRFSGQQIEINLLLKSLPLDPQFFLLPPVIFLQCPDPLLFFLC